MLKSTKKHFVFDLDDTLTDSYDFNQQMFIDTFIPYLDIDKTTESYLRKLHYHNRGVSMELQFKKAINRFSLKYDPKILVKENELLHIKNIEEIRIFESALDLIKIIKNKGKQVSVVSNRQMTSLKLIVNKNSLIKYVDNLISCGDAGYDKPNPYCLNKLIAESNQPKNNFIFIGDSKTDSDFAKNAGIDFIIIDHYINQKKFYKLILQLFI